MPRKSEWLHRVTEIVQEVKALEAPIVDRAAVEQLFRLRRRQAIELMHGFGGYQVGRAFVLDRLELVRLLETLGNGEEFERERRRKDRITNKLEEARRQRASQQVRIPITPEIVSQQVDELPDAIRFGASAVTIQFESVEDLLVHLVELSQAAANDYGRFQRMVERSALGGGTAGDSSG
jgi:hypothetical protein